MRHRTREHKLLLLVHGKHVVGAMSWLPPEDEVVYGSSDDEDNAENDGVIGDEVAARLKGKMPQRGFGFILEGELPEIFVDGAPLYCGKLMLVDVTQGDGMKSEWHIKAALNPVLKEKEDSVKILSTWFNGLQAPHEPSRDEETRATDAEMFGFSLGLRPYDIIAAITFENDEMRYYSPIKLDLAMRIEEDDEHPKIRFYAANNPSFYCLLPPKKANIST